MEIIDAMPGRRRVRYPWDIWTDGRARIAHRGTDYTCTDTSFGSALRNYARRHSLKITHAFCDQGVVFQFTVPVCPGAMARQDATCGKPGPHHRHHLSVDPEALAEHREVVRRNPHVLAPSVPPNSGLHRHDGKRCLDGCDDQADHNCTPECPDFCPDDDEDPRASQG